jgi:hypothetical protein
MPRLTLFERLRPELKEVLDEQALEYLTVESLYTVLKSNTFYADLTIENIRSLTTFADINCMKLSTWDWRYGDAFFIEKTEVE